MARDIDRAGNESPLATVEFVALDANPPPAPGVLGLEQLSGRKITGVDVKSSEPAISTDGRYWYDPSRGKAWPWDGNHAGDEKLVLLVDGNKFMPIADILPRLWANGWETKQIGEYWYLLEGEEILAMGHTFRSLCVNIVLAGY